MGELSLVVSSTISVHRGAPPAGADRTADRLHPDVAHRAALQRGPTGAHSSLSRRSRTHGVVSPAARHDHQLGDYLVGARDHVFDGQSVDPARSFSVPDVREPVFSAGRGAAVPGVRGGPLPRALTRALLLSRGYGRARGARMAAGAGRVAPGAVFVSVGGAAR